MNMEKAKISEVSISDLTLADRWILSKVNTLAKDMTENLDKYELGIAASKVYDFIWEEFCDWYIEMVKPRLYNDDDTTKAAALWTLKTVLIQALKMLHPYMPFITEEIYVNLREVLIEAGVDAASMEESIMIAAWPEFKEEWNFNEDEYAVDTIKDAVRGIRNLRTDMNVPNSKKATVYVVSEKENVRKIFEDAKVFFATLGFASEVIVQADKAGIADDAVSAVIHDAVVYMPFAELVDIGKEKERLTKEEKRLQGEIKRCEGMLNNPNFVGKAPQAKIDEEKTKLEKYTGMLETLKERISQIG